MNQKQNKNWWGRNWTWFVPVGCLGSLGLFAAFIALIVSLVFGIMKSSDVYKNAFSRAKENPAVQNVIGIPIEKGMWVAGNINVNNSSGQADLSIPIAGPKGKATIYVVASKSAGQWTFSTLTVEIKESGQKINLLE